MNYLAQRPHQLVSRAELFRAVWSESIVSATTLTSCIKEIRKALEDDGRSPRYIETAHRRGCRFIAVVTPATPLPSSESPVASAPPSSAPLPLSLTPGFVGREREMAELRTSLSRLKFVGVA